MSTTIPSPGCKTNYIPKIHQNGKSITLLQAILEQHLGADHPHVATSLNNLAELYKLQGRYSEAEPLFLRCLGILFSVLGEDHPNTQSGWQNFVLFLQQVITENRTAELSDHPATQTFLNQLQQSHTTFES